MPEREQSSPDHRLQDTIQLKQLQQTLKTWWWQATSLSLRASTLSPDEQHKSRIIAGLSLIVGVWLLIFFPFRYLIVDNGTDNSVRILIALASSFGMFFIWFISRRGYYHQSSLFLYMITTLAIILTSLTTPEMNILPLYYLIVIPLFSTILLRMRQVIIIVISHLLLMTVAGILRNQFITVFDGPLSFYSITGFLIILMAYFRQHWETLRRKQLAESEHRYRIISELISDYAFEFTISEDETTKIEWITDSVVHITGYTAEEIKNMPDMINVYRTEDQNRVREHIRDVIAGYDSTHDYEIVTPSGATRTVRVYRRPVQDDATQRINRVYGVVQDVTRERESEADKLGLAVERSRLELVNNFVKAISHDFRTTLTNIETSRYLISRKVDPTETEKIQNHLDLIQRDVRHLTEQLVNLNIISHLTTPHTSPCNLNQMIKAVLDEQKYNARQKQIKLTFQPATDLPAIMADENELQRAMGHLVTNALNHTPPDGQVTVSTKINPQSDTVRISVADTGTGIPEEHLQHIFDLFYRVDPARSLQTGGVGLGLSIVEMIVEAHKGSVHVESVPGRGSVFTISLPLTIPVTPEID